MPRLDYAPPDAEAAVILIDDDAPTLAGVEDPAMAAEGEGPAAAAAAVPARFTPIEHGTSIPAAVEDPAARWAAVKAKLQSASEDWSYFHRVCAIPQRGKFLGVMEASKDTVLRIPGMTDGAFDGLLAVARGEQATCHVIDLFISQRFPGLLHGVLVCPTTVQHMVGRPAACERIVRGMRGLQLLDGFTLVIPCHHTGHWTLLIMQLHRTDAENPWRLHAFVLDSLASDARGKRVETDEHKAYVAFVIKQFAQLPGGPKNMPWSMKHCCPPGLQLPSVVDCGIWVLHWLRGLSRWLRDPASGSSLEKFLVPCDHGVAEMRFMAVVEMVLGQDEAPWPFRATCASCPRKRTTCSWKVKPAISRCISSASASLANPTPDLLAAPSAPATPHAASPATPRATQPVTAPATAPSHAAGLAASIGTQLIVTGEGPTPAPPQSGESPSTTLATTIPRKRRHQDETRANNEEPKPTRLRNGDGREGTSTAAPSVPKPTAPSRTVFLPSHTVGGPTALPTPMDTDADDAGAMFMLLLIAFASLVWVMIFSIFTAYYCALWRYNAQFPPSLLRINARYGAIMHNWCCV